MDKMCIVQFCVNDRDPQLHAGNIVGTVYLSSTCHIKNSKKILILCVEVAHFRSTCFVHF